MAVRGLLVASGASSQIVGPAPPRVDTRMDAGGVDAVVFAVGVETLPWLSQEAFEGVAGGRGIGLSAGAHFESGHVVRVRVATATYRDTLAGERARSVTVALDAAWEARVGTHVVLEGGPTLGYTWLSRAIYEERARGPTVGLVVAAAREIGRRWQLRAGARLDWSYFGHTTVVGLPPDPDGGAPGTRLGLALEVGWRT